jgi:hypothetical protein
MFTVIVAATSATTGGAFAAAATGAAGGVLAGYLSKTFLQTSESSAEQLRLYFEQPLTFSQYLAAERLLLDLEGADRTAVTRELIKQMAKSRFDSRTSKDARPRKSPRAARDKTS